MEHDPRSRNRLIEWLVVDGSRLLLTIIISVGLFGLLLILNALGVIGFTDQGSVTRMASGMIAGSLSLVTLVVSVNQLILSQEFSPVGKHRDQFSSVMQFRQDIEQQADIPRTPMEPTRVLSVLADTIGTNASRLAESVADSPNAAYRQQVTQYAQSVEDNAQWVDQSVDEPQTNAFDALSVAIAYDDGWQLSTARYLRNSAPALSAETETAFDDLIESTRLFSSAQEHFKTVYLQRELTRFSQLIIYTGVPAVFAAVFIILIHGGLGTPAISAAALPSVVSLLVTLVFVPLVLLAVFILRTATIIRRTATVGPMLLGERR
ncbi:hypothetical protein [Halohasta litchfieldiae]|uniref:hypothetical protein n=1 Tax=Halohasta litchfieldiae TaxID=1073996 RepID=UPI001C433C9E|nr:hypothetical protein [Halohasta litchfieldiae]